MGSEQLDHGRLPIGHRRTSTIIDLAGSYVGSCPWKSRLVGYGRSKTAIALFVVELDRRHKDRGIRAAAVHAGGGVATDLRRHLDPAQVQGMLELINAELAAEGKPPLQFMTVAQGAATTVWAAVVADADEVGGKYSENCHVGVVVPNDKHVGRVAEGVRAYALDPARARALWAKSEELVGERF